MVAGKEPVGRHVSMARPLKVVRIEFDPPSGLPQALWHMLITGKVGHSAQAVTEQCMYISRTVLHILLSTPNKAAKFLPIILRKKKKC